MIGSHCVPLVCIAAVSQSNDAFLCIGKEGNPYGLFVMLLYTQCLRIQDSFNTVGPIQVMHTVMSRGSQSRIAYTVLVLIYITQYSVSSHRIQEINHSSVNSGVPGYGADENLVCIKTFCMPFSRFSN